MPSSRAQLIIRDVVAEYGSISALQGVSLEVGAGDMAGIIGPNGSGKSTLLRTICRVLRPRTGCVLLDGEDVLKWETRQLAQRLGMVAQESPVSFEFTALEIVLMGRAPYLGRLQVESEADLAIARAAMGETDCWYLADRPITQLSGGEKQRVIIARALAQQPEVLLLDEPTTALDINHQVEILDIIARLNRTEGVTTLVVMHDLNLASQYCDYLAALKDGRVFAVGTPAEVITPETINEVYGADVVVAPHPKTGRPQIVLLPQATEADMAPAGTLTGGEADGG
ncbi:MAG: heme ABC transporter ATP-binding protein [Armatimonadota bacterium]